MTGILSLLLVFGFALTACDTGGDDDDSTTPFEGTWIGSEDTFTIIITGSNWTIEETRKGTFDINEEDGTASFEQTHRWTDGKWEERPDSSMMSGELLADGTLELRLSWLEGTKSTYSFKKK
jgi:hypothetical protein